MPFPDLTPHFRKDDPLIIPWPVPNNPGGFLSFDTLVQWQVFIESLQLRRIVPRIITEKFSRALKLYYLGWIDLDVIKAGELAAMAALELSLRDRYGGRFAPKETVTFPKLINFMVKDDGLTDSALPVIQRCGGTAIGIVSGRTHPSLVEIRNGLAHGDPFNGLPYGGLLELVRDLIDYAYRGFMSP
jgi:hypothetical protein